MESTRQKKVSKLLQKDVAEVIQAKLKTMGHLNVLVSVTKLKVSVDLSVAKIFLSIFPTKMSKQVLKEIVATGPKIKHEIAIKSKKQLRRVPEFFFKLDDSLDYIENIERSLKGLDNPLKPKT